ncbi:MAG TPA: DUF4412 domain-containing protein [Polyangiaceae bacterium]|jgi:hypothetical protein|nr:DUF4412 domain-containing protein [Polyangiaceae bacterium]
MKRVFWVIPVCAVALACNKTESSTTTTTSAADGGAATTTTATATPTSAVGAIVDKALSLVGATPFEGEITMSNTEGSKPAKTITYEVKGAKMRFEAPESAGPMSGGYVIFDTTSKKMIAVQDAKKTAMVMDMGAMGAGLPPGTPPTGPKPTVEKSGKSDTVAGYSCDPWKITEPSGEHTDVCVAQGISFPVMGRHGGGWMSQLDNGFPLRAVSYDATGKEKSRMEVTKIDKKSLDDAMFQVPAGYTTQDMSEMMKNLGALKGMGGFRPPH